MKGFFKKAKPTPHISPTKVGSNMIWGNFQVMMKCITEQKPPGPIIYFAKTFKKHAYSILSSNIKSKTASDIYRNIVHIIYVQLCINHSFCFSRE